MNAPSGTEADRREIADLAARYCRVIDRRRLDELTELYAPGGIDHHTGFDGTIDEFVPWLAEATLAVDGTMHQLGTHLAEIAGDVAVSETYATAFHWGGDGTDPATNYVSLVRYIDHLERIDGRWRIRERWAARERAFSLAGLTVPRQGAGPSGSRTADDPLVRLRASLGFESPPRGEGRP